APGWNTVRISLVGIKKKLRRLWVAIAIRLPAKPNRNKDTCASMLVAVTTTSPGTIILKLALTAAKIEAQLRDIADQESAKRDKKKPPTLQQQIDRACENRRRKWDCFHIATALVLECEVMYSTDEKLQKSPW